MAKYKERESLSRTEVVFDGRIKETNEVHVRIPRDTKAQR